MKFSTHFPIFDFEYWWLNDFSGNAISFSHDHPARYLKKVVLLYHVKYLPSTNFRRRLGYSPESRFFLFLVLNIYFYMGYDHIAPRLCIFFHDLFIFVSFVYIRKWKTVAISLSGVCFVLIVIFALWNYCLCQRKSAFILPSSTTTSSSKIETKEIKRKITEQVFIWELNLKTFVYLINLETCSNFFLLLLVFKRKYFYVYNGKLACKKTNISSFWIS